MGKAEETGQQPHRLSPAEEEPHQVPQAAHRACEPQGGPALGDDEADVLESVILDEDLQVPGDPRERARVENAARRLEDLALIGELTAARFSGLTFEITITELASYGIAVLMASMRTGEIIRQCREKGRPLEDSYAVSTMSRDDRLEVAVETTAKALKYFVDEVLKGGKWDHRKGATLRTYFIGTCLLQLPNVFNAWLAGQRRWGTPQIIDPGDQETAARPDSWSDPTAEAVIRRRATEEALESIKDPRTRKAAEMVMRGFSFAEAGKAAGLSAAAVEGRLFRLRRRLR